jgi:hypothetical protein
MSELIGCIGPIGMSGPQGCVGIRNNEWRKRKINKILGVGVANKLPTPTELKQLKQTL